MQVPGSCLGADYHVLMMQAASPSEVADMDQAGSELALVYPKTSLALVSSVAERMGPKRRASMHPKCSA
jgi:hypothetical protein